MYEAIEFNVNRHDVILTADSFEACKAAIIARGVAHIEDDEEYPNCADALMKDGTVVAIQPVGFKATQPAFVAPLVAHAAKMQAAAVAFDADFGIK